MAEISVKQLADELSVSMRTIQRHIRDLGIEPHQDAKDKRVSMLFPADAQKLRDKIGDKQAEIRELETDIHDSEIVVAGLSSEVSRIYEEDDKLSVYEGMLQEARRYGLRQQGAAIMAEKFAAQENQQRRDRLKNTNLIDYLEKVAGMVI